MAVVSLSPVAPSWIAPYLPGSNPAEVTLTDDPLPSSPNPSSLVGRVHSIPSASSSDSGIDWSSRPDSPSSPRASDPSYETPPTESLTSSCTIEGVASSTHSTPPVPKLDLDSRRRRTSSAPPALTPKNSSPSDGTSMAPSTESSSSPHVFSNSNVLEKGETSTEKTSD